MFVAGGYLAGWKNTWRACPMGVRCWGSTPCHSAWIITDFEVCQLFETFDIDGIVACISCAEIIM